ncbi:hypothetical protein ACIBSV_37070 [Embleya sp. NPDC050154]|uniref:hypothetical protein n=1 Tax=Embleya sp. NPDC050154 TaxID=3363988 RepID=UPI0037A46962
MDRIATGRAAALIRQLASSTAKDGITIQGPTTRSTQITVVSLTASVLQVMLEDCVDVSRRRAVNRDGTPAEIATQSPRFITAVTVTRDAAGWRVADVNARQDRTC